MRIVASILISVVLATSAAEARTVVRIEPNGVKVITMTLPQGTVVIQCDRGNRVLNSTGPIAGLNLEDICRRS